MDTIFAQATPAGRGGVSIIRISGPKAAQSAGMLCKLPKAGAFGLSVVRDLEGEFIDEALVLSFPKGGSFTGDECIEIHLHGSIAVVDKALKTINKTGKCRLAEPGEFTRRALECGNLSLSQVEGLADLIDAETEAQHRQAARVFSGGFGELAEGWRKNLIRALALSEASIDFSDEELPPDVMDEACALVEKTKQEIISQIQKSAISEKIRTGFEVAIIGPPNVGKSTLINAIAQKEVALVSEIAGTTRDVLEARVNISGLPVTFIDTAGLREASDSIEIMGIAKATERAEQADLRVFLIESKDDAPEVSPKEQDIVLLAKGDICGGFEGSISGKTGFGLDTLLNNIYKTLSQNVPNDVVAIRERQKAGLSRCQDNLSAALNHADHNPIQIEVFVTELYSAVRALDFVIGRIDIENILDEIFSSFCLGK